MKVLNRTDFTGLKNGYEIPTFGQAANAYIGNRKEFVEEKTIKNYKNGFYTLQCYAAPC